MNAHTTIHRAVPQSALRFRASLPLTGPSGDPVENAVRRFSGVAYSGQVLNHPYWGRVAFDLATTTATPPLPLLMEHDRAARAGVVEELTLDSRIRVEGRLLDSTDAGREAAALAEAGFPWQLSVYIVPGSIEELAAGAQAPLNGAVMEGPGAIFRNAVIREISLCSVAADPQTSAVAASAGATLSIPVTTRSLSMPPESTKEPGSGVPAHPDLAHKFALLEQEMAALKAENATLRRSHRQAGVERLFADLGRTPQPAELERFHAMDEATFAFVAGQLRAARPVFPERLFTEEAVGGPAGNDLQASIDRMVAL